MFPRTLSIFLFPLNRGRVSNGEQRRMKIRSRRLLSIIYAVTALLLFGNPASAAPILFGSTPLAGATSTVTFEELGVLPNGTIITNQFAPFGLTFSGPAPVYANDLFGNSGPGTFNGSTGFNANFLGNFDGINMMNAADPAVFQISFASPVSGATVAVLSGGGTTTLTSFLGATLVETFSVIPPGPPSANTYFGFDNSLFDSIRFSTTSAPSGNPNIVFDSVSTRSASVPEIDGDSAVVPLVLLALFSLTLADRRVRSASPTLL